VKLLLKEAGFCVGTDTMIEVCDAETEVEVLHSIEVVDNQTECSQDVLPILTVEVLSLVPPPDASNPVPYTNTTVEPDVGPF
jgi:hypothetical protein